MEKEKTVNALNRLVVINKDRIEGYEKASENTEEKDLKSLFAKFVQTSQKCRNELITEIEKLGGKAEDGTKISGKFFRAWMDARSALTGKDRKAILSSCEQGEEKAIEVYKDVLNDHDKSWQLTPKLKSLIKNQYDLINSDKGKIRSMHNEAVEAF